MSLDGSGSSHGPLTEDQQTTSANKIASHSPHLSSTNGIEITPMTSPGPDSSRQEADVGDMSLPAEQRRHLLELESSFKIDSDLRTTPEEESSMMSGRIGDMRPPPLPPVGMSRRGLQRTPSSISNHSKIRSGAATPTTIAGSKEDLRGKKILADTEETTSPFADSAAFSPLQTPVPTSETDSEPNLSSSPTLAAQARSSNRSSISLAAAFLPNSSHEPSPEEIGLAIDRRPSTVSTKGEGYYGSLGSEEATSAVRPTGSVRGRGLSSNSSSNLVGGSTSGTHRRRPKFLRSRQSSQRSSVSSIGDTGMEAGDDGASTITAIEGGGVLSRSTSLGSIASGITGIAGAGSIRGTEGLFGNMSTAAERALARLDEEEKNSRRGSVADGNEASGPKDDAVPEPTTPKSQKPPLPPTDTVITAQVKSVHVPATVAREYRAGHLAPMQTPGSPSKRGGPGATPAPGQGKNMTLKEQSTIIDRLQKENFDLKIKVFYLNEKLEKRSDEGVKEMMKENVDMKVKLAEGMRERKSLKRRIKELEKKIQEMGGEKEGKEDGEDNITELWELKERVERYEVEIEELSRREKEREDRMREEISRKGAAGGERAEEIVSYTRSLF
ncbi:hypothetical protein L873DRAFT_1006996 [Choiromyces venosus 120613-1]|uniref:Centrosomin N-terminal motif 1 domain-containing protein n=1 Tax=Choiromyces venosus 120613-1 TaxID=1336337 RepID=A0A3N4JPI5_9PEZI|nr:hypothetical protein L873DRAFT_1006996 [Choiromyces venosus 120613-1]